MNGKKHRYVVRRKYSNPHTIADAMQAQQMTTVKMAEMMHYSQATASRMKTGKQPVDLNTAIELVEKMQSPFLAMDLANRTIQMSAPVINGNKVIKEPLAMAIRSVPEMQQAITAVNDSLDELSTPVGQVTDMTDVDNAINQLLDVMLYSTNSVAFICEAFHKSMSSELSHRTLEWKRIGIVGE